MKAKTAALVLAAAVWISPAFGQYICPVEPNHSTVAFSVPIAGGITQVTGKFTEFSVEIVYDDEDLTKSSVNATIQAASIDTGIDARDKDLRGSQFFDVENHPEITFRSRRIEKRGDGHVAVGDLTMRGVTRPIELPFRITGVQRSEDGRPILGVSIRWKANRRDYGIGTGWQHTVIPNFIGDEIGVEIDLWTRRGRKGEDPPKQ